MAFSDLDSMSNDPVLSPAQIFQLKSEYNSLYKELLLNPLRFADRIKRVHPQFVAARWIADDNVAFALNLKSSLRV